MYPVFEVFGRQISSYALMVAIGIVISIAILFVACRREKKSFDDAVYIYVFSLMGVVIGAMLLSTLVNLYVSGFSAGVLLRGGFVFWGGFIGGWIAAVVAAKYFGKEISEYYSVLVPAVILFAGFGRVGCFLTGCCYGKVSELFGLCYTMSEIAPNGVPLIPIQLVEAFFDFALAICLFGKKNAMYKYAVIYSLFRFFAEFFRGDPERGFIGPLSVSQLISICVLVFSAILYLKSTGESKAIDTLHG